MMQATREQQILQEAVAGVAEEVKLAALLQVWSPPLSVRRQQQQQCVYMFSSHLFWTSNSLDVPAGVTQKEGHTGFLIYLPSAMHAFIFLARRNQPLLSLVDHEVEFCVLTI